MFEPRRLTVDLGLRLFEAVNPRLGSAGSGDVSGEARSGDYTYALDEVAEQMLESAVAEVGEAAGVRLAFYSEDRGLVAVHSDPQYVLVIDPIDGTRPAICGLESCCVSVAVAPLDSDVVRLGDVAGASLVEIKSGRTISAERDGRVFDAPPPASARKETRLDGRKLSAKRDVRHLFWAHEMCARPAEAVHGILSALINDSSFGGGVFLFNSSSYGISRVVLGQLDAYLDPAAEIFRSEAAEWAARSRRLFGGKVFGIFPYDIAAAAFIAMQAGAVVSDARGEPLGKMNLLDSSERAITSCLVAGNRDLADLLLNYIATGLKSLS
jgi:myo-inositol-1(or 4)-monophosphatase